MAAKRKRGSTWEFKFTRKGVLPKPKSFTFDSEEEGDVFAAHAEKLLNEGIVPPGFVDDKSSADTLGTVISEYIANVSINSADKVKLETILSEEGRLQVINLTYDWCEDWIRRLKIARKIKPSTVKKYKGALQRCFTWSVAKGYMVTNHLILLPKSYAQYSEHEARVLGLTEEELDADDSRERRFEGNEEERIREILAGYKPNDKQRQLVDEYMAAYECMFNLAVETAMRMREIYTLDNYQVDLSKKTIFLEKTKNGSKRQVALSSDAIKAVREYREHVGNGTRGMVRCVMGKRSQFLPFWDGDTSYSGLERTTRLLSRFWGKVFDHAGLDDFRFHDLRHEATSRFFEKTKLSEMRIAKITGHKKLASLDRYANLRGSDLADELW